MWTYLDSEILRYCDSLDAPGFITAIYLIKGTPDLIQARIRALALEESTGSWLDLPLESIELRRRYAARVTGLYSTASSDGDKTSYVALVAYPIEDFGDNLPLLLSYVFGGISALPDVRLLDIRVPAQLAESYGGGPRFGLDYLRSRVGREAEPLLMGIVKPCVGLDISEHANIASEMAAGGADIIKDDELLANQSFSPSERRCEAVVSRIQNTSGQQHTTLYFPNVTDRPGRAVSQALRLKEAGAGGVLLNGFATGLGLIRDIVDAAELPVALHPAMAGAMYQAPQAGIDERVVFGRLPRLSGADIVILFGPYGKFRLQLESLEEICFALSGHTDGWRASVPAIAAGVHPGQVHEIIARFGPDIIFVAGASVVAHPAGPQAGAMAFRQAIISAMRQMPLQDAIREHKELRTAVESWGDTDHETRYAVLG